MRKSSDAISFYKAVLGAVASHGFALTISFVSSVLMTRALGAEGRGVYSWIVSLSIIGACLAQAGMGHTNRRFIANRHHRSATLFTLTLIICAGASLLVCLVLGLIALTQQIGQENKLALLTGLIAVPISAIGITAGEMLVGLRKNAQYSSLNIIEKSTNTLFILLFIAIGIISPLTGIISLVIAATARLSIILYYLRNDIKLKLKGAGYILNHIGSFTFFNYLASSVVFMSTHILTVFVGSMTTITQVGWFAANMIIITALRQLASITATFALPRLARTPSYQDRTKLKNIIIATTMALTLMAVIVR